MLKFKQIFKPSYTRFFVFFTVLLTAFLISTNSDASAEEVISFAYMDSYLPFNGRIGGKLVGINIDIINEAVKNRLGISVSHHGYPWKRAQYYVNTGRHDAMLTTPTEARAEYGVFGKEPTLDRSYSIITFKGSPFIDEFNKVKKLEDLKPFLRADFRGNGWTEKYMKDGYKIRYVSETDQIWKVLVRKRADYALANPYVIKATLKKMGFHDKLVAIQTKIPELNFYHVLIVSKKSSIKWIVPKFDEALREMKKDGTYQAILDKWYSKELK